MDAFVNVGDAFDSFGDAEKRIKELQDGRTIQLYRRDCKTSVASMQRYPGRAGRANPVLKYYLLEYCCVCGGKKYKSRTTGDRVKTKYVLSLIARMWCVSSLRLSVASTGQNWSELVRTGQNRSGLTTTDRSQRQSQRQSPTPSKRHRVCRSTYGKKP